MGEKKARVSYKTKWQKEKAYSETLAEEIAVLRANADYWKLEAEKAIGQRGLWAKIKGYFV